MTTQQSSQDESFPQEEYQPIDFGLSNFFDYEELQEATKFFNPSFAVGEGAFGEVFRGELADGRVVALKVLSISDNKRLEHFINEVRIISGLRHKNLAILYGCTSPDDEKLVLVYEFVPNGTVANHLHGPRISEGALTWDHRIRIAIETAEALNCLHSHRPPIMHRDVKSDNILLDNNFDVKLADFGLCRLLPVDALHVSTMPQGTQGYLDPEYNQSYKLTTKSDVYSFGVVLMELVSGKPVLDEERGTDDEIWLVRMAFNKIKNKRLEQLIDPKLEYCSDLKTREMVTSVAKLARRCLQPKGHMRPPILEVLMTLKAIRNGKQLARKESLEQCQCSPPPPSSQASRSLPQNLGVGRGSKPSQASRSLPQNHGKGRESKPFQASRSLPQPSQESGSLPKNFGDGRGSKPFQAPRGLPQNFGKARGSKPSQASRSLPQNLGEGRGSKPSQVSRSLRQNHAEGGGSEGGIVTEDHVGYRSAIPRRMINPVQTNAQTCTYGPAQWSQRPSTEIHQQVQYGVGLQGGYCLPAQVQNSPPPYWGPNPYGGSGQPQPAGAWSNIPPPRMWNSDTPSGVWTSSPDVGVWGNSSHAQAWYGPPPDVNTCFPPRVPLCREAPRKLDSCGNPF